MFYHNELKAIKRVDRFREREIFNSSLIDLASNDYLALSKNRQNFKRAYEKLLDDTVFAPKASMLVNGYTKIHKEFEEKLSTTNGFEDAILVGSGYLANIALVEALVRKKDKIFIDEEFHSSGVLASKLIDSKRVVIFKHNNPQDLKVKLKKSSARNKIVLVEGIYSMSGNILNKGIFNVVDEVGAVLVVDEAHSSGVIGDRVLGVFDYYEVDVQPHHIKMGTLGKAYGSYGAYILASSEIITFLVNRAKPIIYSTALSLFDTALAMVNFEYILENSYIISQKIKDRVNLSKKLFNHEESSLIVKIVQKSNIDTKRFQKELVKNGFLVGAIREPTVLKPILRVIPNIGVNDEKLIEFAKICKKLGIMDVKV